MTLYKLLPLLFLCVPLISQAEVIFSEIAWMGSETNASDEWIEIYNVSSSSEDVHNWTVTDTGSLSITLSGVMPPHGVFMLERSDDDSAPGVAADIIYTGALTNSGTTLTIKNDSGVIIGTPLIGGDNWENIGGDNELKHTAQQTLSGDWVTGAPTPGVRYFEENTAENIEVAEEDNSKSGGGGGPVRRVAVEPVVLSDIEHTLSLEIKNIEKAYVNKPVTFSYTPTGAGETLMRSLKTYWNFGDTYTSNKKSPTHTYAYPGSYVVTLEGWFGKQRAITQSDVQVVDVEVEILPTDDNDIIIKNISPHDLDISNFTLKGNSSFEFPKHSFLRAGKPLVIERSRILGWRDTILLFDQKKHEVAQYSERPHDVVVQKFSEIPVSKPKVESFENEVSEEVIESKVIDISAEAVVPKHEGIISQFFNTLKTFFAG